MRQRMLAFSAVLALALTAAAKDYYVYPDVRQGMTGPQQMTNALYSMNGLQVDTIHVMPGTYDFTGVTMGDGTQHLRSDGKNGPLSEFKIVGETTGHWDGAVIFTASDGIKIMNFSHEGGWTSWQGSYPTIANITFSNCTASASGAAIQFALWTKMITKQKWPNVTNCVFKSCGGTSSDAKGGAIFGGVKATDCRFLDCTATTRGGAISGGTAYGSHFERCSAVNGGAIDLASDATTPPVLSNCVFVSNKATSNSGGALYGDGAALGAVVSCAFTSNSAANAGGACHFSDKGLADFRGCAFTNNVVRNNNTGGGAVNYAGSPVAGIGFHGCSFVSNVVSGTSSPGGAVRGTCLYESCEFVGNTTTNANGGAIYAAFAGCVVTNCAFTGNAAVKEANNSYPIGGAIACADTTPVTVTRCAFTNNVAGWNAGAVAYGAVSDSSFKDNYSSAAGGALYKCTAVRCRFTGDYSGLDYRSPGGVAESILSDCDVACSIVESAATRCNFHDINETRDLAVFYNSNWVTNSLVTRCGRDLRGIVYSYSGSTQVELVNCTFATNTPNWYWGMFTARNGDISSPVKAINCAFFGTVDSKGTAKDIWGRNMNNVSLDHCAYGIADSACADKWTNVGNTTFQCANPKFVGDGDYQLTRKSPLREKGALLNWTASDKDLAGNPRLRDGKVDIGCYECWGIPPGMILFLR